ncbi:MAG TPA: hypothetical protein PLS56_00355 [Candidatus Dojkabacteria bacterium]|jgi:uncharacterized membrane protein|nr:hypothetical protein [Candidatus Dojkabacteria bacterium]
MSKLLKRALKIAVWPAIIMIAAKVLGILGINALYNLDYYIDNQIEGIYSVQICYTDPSSTILVNSLSDIIMIVALALPTFYFTIKTLLYETSFQNPRTIVKITELNILKWITKKGTTFLQIFIWSAFLTTSSAIAIAHSVQGNAYSWVGITAMIIGILSIWGMIKTYQLETDKIYPRENIYY